MSQIVALCLTSSNVEGDLSPCVIRVADCGWLTFTTSVGQMSPSHMLNQTGNTTYKTMVSSIKLKCCDCTLKWPLCYCITARNMAVAGLLHWSLICTIMFWQQCSLCLMENICVNLPSVNCYWPMYEKLYDWVITEDPLYNQRWRHWMQSLFVEPNHI